MGYHIFQKQSSKNTTAKEFITTTIELRKATNNSGNNYGSQKVANKKKRGNVRKYQTTKIPNNSYSNYKIQKKKANNRKITTIRRKQTTEKQQPVKKPTNRKIVTSRKQ